MQGTFNLDERSANETKMGMAYDIYSEKKDGQNGANRYDLTSEKTNNTEQIRNEVQDALVKT